MIVDRKSETAGFLGEREGENGASEDWSKSPTCVCGGGAVFVLEYLSTIHCREFKPYFSDYLRHVILSYFFKLSQSLFT